MGNPLAEQLVVRTRRDGGRFLVTCRGEIDLATRDHLYDSVIGGIEDGRTLTVQVDLAGVTFVSAAGLRSLVRLFEAAQGAGKPFHFDRLPPLVHRLLDIVGVDEVSDFPEPKAQ
jgi:anti-sigma B factor antagonist